MAQNKIALKWLVEKEKDATFFVSVFQKCNITVNWGDGKTEVLIPDFL